MAESALSSEVTATTVLPAPSGLSSSYSDGTISLSWTNNDDSSDGGLEVERSTDGGSTWSTLASGLATTTTSYDDTSVSTDSTYDYRVTRNTDHATATSGTTTVQTLNQIGTAQIDKSGTTLDVPIYSQDSLDATWLRVRLSDGTVGVLRPIDKTGEPFRTQKDSTVYGIETEQSLG